MMKEQKHTPKILVVEDEKKIAALIKKSLESESYLVETASDGEKGELALGVEPFDLVILDIMMPKMDGLQLLNTIRKNKNTIPVLMLTAKDTIEDRVRGLDTGADDYLIKPFAIEELLARVRSLLRRKGNDQPATNQLTIADLTLDIVSRKAVRGGKTIDLTAREFALLEFFIRNRNKTIPRSSIAAEIWNYNFDTGTNIIDVYVNHLRAKIDGGFSAKLIHTVRGVGYIMKDE